MITVYVSSATPNGLYMYIYMRERDTDLLFPGKRSKKRFALRGFSGGHIIYVSVVIKHLRIVSFPEIIYTVCFSIQSVASPFGKRTVYIYIRSRPGKRSRKALRNFWRMAPFLQNRIPLTLINRFSGNPHVYIAAMFSCCVGGFPYLIFNRRVGRVLLLYTHQKKLFYRINHPNKMFEAPIIPVKEFLSHSAKSGLNSRFIFDESNEVVDKAGGDLDVTPKSKTVPIPPPTKKNSKTQGKRKRKQQEEDPKESINKRYSGLYTGAIYNNSGELQSNITHNKQFDVERDKLSRKGGPYTTPLKTYELYINGLEPMPRPVSPMRVVRDSPKTHEALHSNDDVEEFSSQTRRIVTKNNIPKGAETSVFSVSGGENMSVSDDSWFHSSLRVRHTHIVSSIVHLSMLRGDYILASRAFALLIRAKYVDIRVTWTIGLELLVWRREMRLRQEENSNDDVHTMEDSLSKKEDEGFLEWLVVNYPHVSKRKKSKWKHRPRAPDFYPYLIMSKLRTGNPAEALDRLQELMLESPYSDMPIFYALSGISIIQMLTQKEEKEDIIQLAKKAKRYFEKCVSLGGIYPKDFIDYELFQFVDDDVDLEDDE